MKVLVLVAGLPWLYGPYQQQGAYLAKGLQERGHDVFWLPTMYSLDERKAP